MENPVNIYSLFEQTANDSPKAFQLLFDYTYTQLYRYTNYFISDRDICKDVVSDIYLYLWQNRKQLPKVQNYENYLFVCARNQSLRYLKQNDRFQKVRLEDTDIRGLSDHTNPEQKALDEELREMIELAVNTLPNRCRLIFFLVREENKTYREVADMLSISSRTVQTQLYIAVKKIGEVIKEYRSGKYKTMEQDEMANKK